jgi:hypothetical protein
MGVVRPAMELTGMATYTATPVGGREVIQT